MQVINHCLQGGTKVHPSSFYDTLNHMSENCGVYGLMEHSVCSGADGFHYFLRRDFFLHVLGIFLGK